MKHHLLAASVLLLAACSSPTAQLPADEHAVHSDTSSTQSSVDRLSNSPRHQEWVEVKNGDKTIHTFVVYPESAEKAPVVILIHENKGLNDWARGMADQVAEAGYIAVAPDLLSEFSADMQQTSDFATPDDATKAIGQLQPENVMADLNAVAAWAETIPASNGKLASAGFCWGGARSFEFAADSENLDVAMVFYGTSPANDATYDAIDIPVYGFYGGADERVNATIPTAEQGLETRGKEFPYVIYDGAGHAFMRSGEDPAGDPANVAARNAAWERMKAILADL